METSKNNRIFKLVAVPMLVLAFSAGQAHAGIRPRPIANKRAASALNAKFRIMNDLDGFYGTPWGIYIKDKDNKKWRLLSPNCDGGKCDIESIEELTLGLHRTHMRCTYTAKGFKEWWNENNYMPTATQSNKAEQPVCTWQRKR